MSQSDSTWISYHRYVLDPTSPISSAPTFTSTLEGSDFAPNLNSGFETTLLNHTANSTLRELDMNADGPPLASGKADFGSRTVVNVPLASVFMLYMLCNNSETIAKPTYDPHGYFILPAPVEGRGSGGPGEQIVVSVSRNIDVQLG